MMALAGDTHLGTGISMGKKGNICVSMLPLDGSLWILNIVVIFNCLEMLLNYCIISVHY